MVAQLKAAGAIPIARTNLSEMGLRLCTDNPLHGRTLKPYHRKLTVGGSSGGDVAAVGPEPSERTTAIVTSLPGAPLPASAVAAVQRAAEGLEGAGWELEEATPPDLQRVLDVFARP